MHILCRLVEFSSLISRAVTVSTITSLVLVWGLSGAIMLSRFNNYALPQMIFQAGLPPSHCIYVSVRYALPNMLCRFTTRRFTTCLLFLFHRRAGTVLLLSHTKWGEMILSTCYPLQVALSMRTVFRVSHAELFCLLLASP